MSMQEVGEQLFHDRGLVDGDDVISVFNDLDARLGQSLAETGCHLRPIVDRFVSADHYEDRNLGSREWPQVATRWPNRPDKRQFGLQIGRRHHADNRVGIALFPAQALFPLLPRKDPVVSVAVEKRSVTVLYQPSTHLLGQAGVGAGVIDEHVRHDCLPRPDGCRIENVLIRRTDSKRVINYLNLRKPALGVQRRQRLPRPGRLQEKSASQARARLLRLTCARLGTHRRRATAPRRVRLSVLDHGGEPSSRQADEPLDERLRDGEMDC